MEVHPYPNFLAYPLIFESKKTYVKSVINCSLRYQRIVCGSISIFSSILKARGIGSIGDIYCDPVSACDAGK